MSRQFSTSLRRKDLSLGSPVHEPRALRPLRADGPGTAQTGRDQQGLSVFHR